MMKSVKPGRATWLACFIGSISIVVFGIAWSVLVVPLFAQENEMQQPHLYFFLLFGIVFIGIGIASTIFNYKNTYSKNRYSLYDVVDSSQEDFFRFKTNNYNTSTNSMNYCPYCGNVI
ncbi:MAG: hypothetical protein N3F66_05000 [Spirochaetes bacterium]|nr:hypothetical protein [Spirochaetota bacterium]